MVGRFAGGGNEPSMSTLAIGVFRLEPLVNGSPSAGSRCWFDLLQS